MRRPGVSAAAIAGMAAILIGLGVFSAISDYQGRQEVVELRRARDLSEAYDETVANLDRMDAAANRFILTRSHDDYVEFGQQLDEATGTVRAIASIGTEEDRALASDVVTNLLPQANLARDYLGRIDRQEPLDGPPPDEALFYNLRTRLRSEAIARDASSRALFDRQVASQRWHSVVTLAIDLVALGLVLSLAITMRRNHNKETEAMLRERALERAARTTAEESAAKLVQADRLAKLVSWEAKRPFTAVELSSGLQELVGAPSPARPQDLLNRIAAEDRAAVATAFGGSLRSGNPLQVDCSITASDGSRRSIRMYADVRMGTDGAPEAIFGACQDVTEIDRAQRRLIESQAELKALFDGSTDVLVLVNPEFCVTAFNDAAARYARVFAGVELADGMFIGDAFRATFGDEAIARAMQALAGEPVSLDRELKDPAGINHWFEVSYVPIRLESSKLLGMALMVRDVTERRVVEAQLLQAQKMESIGRLAGGVAHDFNNLLTAIIGYDELATAALAHDQEARADIEESLKAARKAATLTQQLLAFARRQVVAPVDVDVNDLIVNMDRLLQRLIGDDVELICALAPHPVVAHIDPGQFEQVVVNLAVNARDAMPDGGQLTIESREVVLNRDYAASRPDLAPGAYVLVSVTDTGMGMPDEITRQIFEPFFTTKEQGKGTGLGLATCYGIVKQAGGHIAVYSEPGHGTTFKIYLPVASLAVPSHRESSSASMTEPARGSGVVLLVEDQAEVRALTERVLRSHGYDVIAAPDPIAALELARNAPRVDLIVSDVVMPGMDGLAMIDILIRMLGPRPVVLMSGFAEEPVMARVAERNDVVFVSKPVGADRLLREVAAAVAAFHASSGVGSGG